ncbi:CarD family transcriptional regulator [Romboutsia sp.]|uniref:CarD family transcriptional regulator n=1 Tax=Romboutsia sp. TaxID=1965302 RepID=UPI003F2D79C0
MYKIGEFIVYGNDGVCEIEDISELDIPGINKKKKYYILKPMHDNGKVFAPIDTTVFMRSVMTYEEIQKIIEQIPLITETEFDGKNVRLLQDYYKNLLKTHECIDLLTVIASINDKKANSLKNGKKLGQIDEKFMKMARNLLQDEFSIVLGIPKEEVEAYIEDRINKNVLP